MGGRTDRAWGLKKALAPLRGEEGGGKVCQCPCYAMEEEERRGESIKKRRERGERNPWEGFHNEI